MVNINGWGGEELKESILSILLFLLIIWVLEFLSNFMETIREVKFNKEHENWLKYGLISKKDLCNLEPDEFQEWCENFLDKIGYGILNNEEPLLQRGLLCEKEGKKIYVECNNKCPIIGVEDLQKLIGTMVYGRINNGILITTGLISSEGRKYMEGLPDSFKVKVIDGEELLSLHRELRERNIYVNNKNPEIEGIGL